MEVRLHPFFPALDGAGSSDWCPSPFTRGKRVPDRLGSPRASLDHLQERKIFLPCRNWSQDPIVLQPVNWLLYRLCLITLHRLLSVTTLLPKPESEATYWWSQIRTQNVHILYDQQNKHVINTRVYWPESPIHSRHIRYVKWPSSKVLIEYSNYMS